MKKTTVIIPKIQMKMPRKLTIETLELPRLVAMVKKLLSDDIERCIDSYLLGVRARTAMDLVKVASYLDNAKIAPYVEYGQLFITDKWRMRHSCLTEEEQRVLQQALYMKRVAIPIDTQITIIHNLESRMGLAMATAFRCMYYRTNQSLSYQAQNAGLS